MLHMNMSKRLWTKVAKLRLKTPLKMIGNLIGTKVIAQAKLRRGLENIQRGSGELEKGMD